MGHRGQQQVLKEKTSKDPEKDAWTANFYTENHLAWELFSEVATPEQLKFMVYMGDEVYYYPCSDEVFSAIMEKKGKDLLPILYFKVWEEIEPLIEKAIDDSYKKRFLLNLLRIKFRHETATQVVLPSRLEKRLLHIFTRVAAVERPLAIEKEKKNQNCKKAISSRAFIEALNDPSPIKGLDCASLDRLQEEIFFLKLKRLLSLTSHPKIWEEEREFSKEEFLHMMNGSITGDGLAWFRSVSSKWLGRDRRHYILWMGLSAGQCIIDLEIIRLLIQMGIKVIIATKNGFYFDAITMDDALEDHVLLEYFKNALYITNHRISKKELIEKLKSDYMLFIISDGTQERFNPLLTSVTFARAFKESDIVVCRSLRDMECIHDSHFQFTRDVLSVVAQEDGVVSMNLRPHHPNAVRFSERDLAEKAEALIYHLKRQKRRGKTIMFYSAIVGSIPNQMETAKQVLKVFVDYLRSKQEDVLVINPAEHFEPGMDADDIMYMWEIVQRSGLIDIWRFQTVEDIEKAFELMGKKVPPEWVGKDATYSTGCTKEMQIAIEVQKEHPEMQIIGPPWQKFLRRKEYGVGKLYDRVLDEK